MKISTTILSATLLAGALALAGCGGSGNGAMDDDMDMDSGPTAEERAEAAEAEIAKRDKAAAEEKAAADAKAALDMAKTLHGVLMADATSMIKTDTTGKAANDEQNSMSISVMGEAFSKAYPAGSTSGGVTGVSGDGKHTLTLGTTSVTHTKIMGSAFSTSAPKVHMQENVRSGTTDAYFSTPGSYHGVAGTYECAASDPKGCTSQVDSGGEGIVLAGAWTFTPSDEKAPVNAADGVKWGWWLKKGTDKNVIAAHAYYMAGTNGLVAVDAGLPDGHGGKATYMGDAIGQYSVYGGANGENDSGAFQADATLQATFGDNPAISGTIDNFMGADGMPRMWSVDLQKLTTGADGNAAATSGKIAIKDGGTGGMVVWTMDGEKASPAGMWEVTAYADSDSNDVDPSAVAGGFRAVHDTNRSRMIGAFGAEKQ